VEIGGSGVGQASQVLGSSKPWVEIRIKSWVPSLVQLRSRDPEWNLGFKLRVCAW
uniref:Uncharacterized protein n=1 Tax=Cannabis sativa TaxID=3483 RepID=A0A803QRW1_CANSA